MKSFILILMTLFALQGCAESEYEQCKTEASKLWDNTKNAKNEAYWQAIEACKKKYDKE